MAEKCFLSQKIGFDEVGYEYFEELGDAGSKIAENTGRIEI